VDIPYADYAAGSAELGGWTVLQQSRVLCGFGALMQNHQLDAAAKAHAKYLISVSLATGQSLLSHYETDTTNPNYTGYTPWNRAEVQGYGTQVGEILESLVWTYDVSNPPALPSLEQRGAQSMRSLLNTVYHLSGAMYDGSDVGFGADVQVAINGTLRREEYRFGSLNGYQHTNERIRLGAGKLATYPCEGSSNIPSTFIPSNESPNPFPHMANGQAMGPPMYIKVDSGQVLTISNASVMAGNSTVPITLLTHINDANIDANEVFVIPTSALDANTSYQVNFSGSINNTPFSRSFTMTTGS
jgi:hypothetical protein